MLQKITDIAGLTAAALLLLTPAIVLFLAAEGLLWSMLYFTR